MKVNKISELGLDRTDEIVLYLSEVNETVAKNGKPYCNLKLQDGGPDPIQAKLWDMKKEDLLKEVALETPVKVSIKTQIFNGQKSYICSSIGKAPAGTDPSMFAMKSDMDTEMMFTDIVDGPEMDTATVAKVQKWERFPGLPRLMKNQDLLLLVQSIYRKNKEAVLKSSAAQSNHHAYRGGLLEHTYRMLMLALPVSAIYKSTDRDVLLAGTALHDIGKIVELETTDLGASSYTTVGRMLGHMVIGINMVEAEVAEAAGRGEPYTDTEAVLQVKHCIAAHHGKLEWGAASVPMIPEAMILHEIDMIDAGMKEFSDALRKTEPGCLSSERIFALGAYVYRPTEG